MAKRKKNHRTTKNTMAKPPISKLRVIGVECNGYFELVTDFKTQEEFNALFHEWFDHPATNRWCAETLIGYIKSKRPNRICVLQEDFDRITKGKMIPATKEEWEAENN
jgi:hypothetical protein